MNIFNRIQTGSSSMSFGWRGLFGDDIPIDAEFFQCTPIFILLFDTLAILSF